MRRSDATVLSISAALAAVVVVILAASVAVDRRADASSAVSAGQPGSWLVVSWAPGFCRVEPQNRGCTSGEAARQGRTLILHGLWPQPRERQYCGVDDGGRGDEGGLAPVTLSAQVADALRSTMVNAQSQVGHEWYAHGTCAAVSPDAYFADAAALTEQARAAFDPVLRDAVGGRVTLAALRRQADVALGDGAGERLAIGCRSVTGEGAVVEELRFSLPPVVSLRDADGSLSLPDLVRRGNPLAAGCRHGAVTG